MEGVGRQALELTELELIGSPFGRHCGTYAVRQIDGQKSVADACIRTVGFGRVLLVSPTKNVVGEVSKCAVALQR
eukprot:2050986-Pleurochrysis_carterae.AAC.1